VEAFFEDLEALRIERPEQIARATEHIPQMVALIERLAAAGAAYKTEDGSWYFRLAAFPEYGKLSKKDLSGMEDGARVDVDEYEKDSARDFALWKAAKPGETSWETAIGRGRPGWHIECSAMAMEYLGESFDLHCGGEDLMFPHHENEIAQSETATHKQFARHWMHVRFLLVDGRKMSKSEGNFYTLRDLLLKGYKASAIRLALISVPYRHQLNFTFEGLTEATNAIDRLRTFPGAADRGNFAAGENAPDAGGGEEGASRVHGGAGQRSEHRRGALAPSSSWSARRIRPSTRAVFRRRPRRDSAGAEGFRRGLRCDRRPRRRAHTPRDWNGPSKQGRMARWLRSCWPRNRSPMRPLRRWWPSAPRPRRRATLPAPTRFATSSRKRA
jgi:hypothetical protein